MSSLPTLNTTLPTLNTIDIEGQPTAAIFLQEGGQYSIQEVYFGVGLEPNWKPNVPGNDLPNTVLCYNANAATGLEIFWAEERLTTHNPIRFEDLRSSDQNRVLELLGIVSGESEFANWLLNNGDLNFLELPPKDGLRRLTSFPETDLRHDEPANGVFYRRGKDLLCWSSSGLCWSTKWIRPVIRVENM